MCVLQDVYKRQDVHTRLYNSIQAALSSLSGGTGLFRHEGFNVSYYTVLYAEKCLPLLKIVV